MLEMWFLLACQTPDAERPPEVVTDTVTTADPLIPPERPRLPTPVVIIGAGPAGLAAAMDLPNCTVLEADSEVGGRFRWAGGLALMVGTEEQAALGVVDSPEDAVAEWPQIAGAEATEDTLAYFQASDAVHDRLTELGVTYRLTPGEDWVGTPRIHQPVGGGVAVVAALAAAVPDTVDLRLNTPATGIVMEGTEVVGVQTAEEVIPAHTVILASGGFVNRMEVVQELHDYKDGSWMVGTEGGATGFAYDQAVALGIPMASLAAIGWFTRTIGVTGPDGLLIPFPGKGQLPWITVDQDGVRILDENRTGSVTTSGVLGEHTNVWSLTTWELVQASVAPDAIPRLQTADPDQFVCASDWSELAERTGLADLTATLQAVDNYRLGQAQDPIGRRGTSFPDLNGTPCAFRLGHEAAKNFGGLVVDKDGRVPGFDGLWAIGEAAGMAAPGIGGAWGYDGSSGAVIWSGWRTAAAVWGKSFP